MGRTTKLSGTGSCSASRPLTRTRTDSCAHACTPTHKRAHTITHTTCMQLLSALLPPCLLSAPGGHMPYLGDGLVELLVLLISHVLGGAQPDGLAVVQQPLASSPCGFSWVPLLTQGASASSIKGEGAGQHTLTNLLSHKVGTRHKQEWGLSSPLYTPRAQLAGPWAMQPNTAAAP